MVIRLRDISITLHICRLCRSGAPIYEIPEAAYTGEEILGIINFLSEDQPGQNLSRMASPITKSCTFVVDLDELKHPDNIKKGEFGK